MARVKTRTATGTEPTTTAGRNVPAALRRSNDQKVTNYVMGTDDKPRVGIANTFGLPSGKQYSCPSQTEFCADICYAGAIERLRKAVTALLMSNWELLRDATREEMIALLSDMIAGFVADCDRRNAPRLFRIHWDGDFFSAEYLAAWDTVIAANPSIQFWVYTRVAPFAIYLHKRRRPNLSLYFSADRDNITVARTLKAKGIRIAYVARTFDDGRAEFPDAMPCPENQKKLALISSKGSACVRCGMCVYGRRDILFRTTKR